MAAGLTQEDLAARLGVKRQQIQPETMGAASARKSAVPARALQLL